MFGNMDQAACFRQWKIFVDTSFSLMENGGMFSLGIIALVLAAVGAILWAVLAFKGTD